MNSPFVLFSYLLACTATALAEGKIAGEWELLNPKPTQQTLAALTATENRFFAGGSRIVTSEDGLTWTERTNRVTQPILSLAFGNGRFIGVETPGLLIESGDGTNWSKPRIYTNAAGYPVYFSSVNFEGGRFHLAGFGVSLLSTNGIDWRETAIPGVETTSGNGLLVAGSWFNRGEFPKGIFRVSRDDGITWDSREQNFVPRALTFGAGRFISVGGVSIYASEDGVNWTEVAVNEKDAQFRNVRYLRGRFIAVGDAGSVFTSSDGIDWVKNYDVAPGRFLAAAATGSIYVVVGSTGEIATSTNGVNWMRRSSGTRNALGGITFSDGRYVAAGSEMVLSSSNARDWSEVAVDVIYFVGVAAGEGRIIAMGYGGEFVESTDGMQWRKGKMSTNHVAVQSIDYVNGRFMVGALEAIYSSDDGVTWLKHTLPKSVLPGMDIEIEMTATGVAWGNGRYVATGGTWNFAAANSAIFTSQDGQNWNLQTLPSTYILTDVTFGEGLFVAARYDNNGSREHIFTSTDGLNWEQAIVPYDELRLREVAFGAGWFVAVGLNGEIIASKDGRNWQKVNQWRSDADLWGITFGDGRFVAVGDDGTVLGSPWLEGTTALLRFASIGLPGQELVAQIDGEMGTVVTIEASTDLKDWNLAGTVTNVNGSISFRENRGAANRFFRATEVK